MKDDDQDVVGPKLEQLYTPEEIALRLGGISVRERADPQGRPGNNHPRPHQAFAERRPPPPPLGNDLAQLETLLEFSGAAQGRLWY